MSEYAKVLLFSIAIPFALSFFKPLKIYKHKRALLFSNLAILIIFGSWDVFATWRGHWEFNRNYVWEIRVLNLPLEEVLFFVVIPFCCIFSWEAINYLKSKIK